MNWMCNVLGATFLTTAQGMAGDFYVEAIGAEAQLVRRSVARSIVQGQCTYLATVIECIQDEIKQVAVAAQEENWDFDGACSASEDSIVFALDFVSHLWAEVSYPRISVDKKGRIMLEWEPDETQYCGLTFDRENVYRCVVKNRIDDDYTLITSPSASKILEAIASVSV